MRYIYKIKFKGKGDVVAEDHAEALKKLKEQLNGLDIEYMDIIGEDNVIRTDDVYEQMKFICNMTRASYEFITNHTEQRTTYSEGYEKGFLKGQEAMLEELKGMLYGHKDA